MSADRLAPFLGRKVRVVIDGVEKCRGTVWRDDTGTYYVRDPSSTSRYDYSSAIGQGLADAVVFDEEIKP